MYIFRDIYLNFGDKDIYYDIILLLFVEFRDEVIDSVKEFIWLMEEKVL